MSFIVVPINQSGLALRREEFEAITATGISECGDRPWAWHFAAQATCTDVRIDYLVEELPCEIGLVLGRCVTSRLFDAPRRFAVCAYSAIQWTIVSMSLHHWLGSLAFYLAWLWLGQTLQRPLPEPVAIAAFDDGYLIPREFRFAGETFPDREAKTDACLWSGLNGEAAARTLPALARPGPERLRC